MQTVIPPRLLSADLPGTDRHTALAVLHDRNIDMVKGFATMAEKAEPTFRDTAERFRALHARHADALARLLADLGVDTSPDGTLMGYVHTAVVSVRAFLDAIDEDVMDQVRAGEASLMQSYDDAIAESVAHGFVSTLQQMRAEVQAEVAATQHLG